MYKKLEDKRCHVEQRFNILDGKWNIMLLCILSDGEPVRYGELRRRLNDITDAALSNALRSLVREGVVERQAYHEIPPRVEYTLTESGKELVSIVQMMCRWSDANRTDHDDSCCWRANRSAGDQ